MALDENGNEIVELDELEVNPPPSYEERLAESHRRLRAYQQQRDSGGGFGGQYNQESLAEPYRRVDVEMDPITVRDREGAIYPDPETGRTNPRDDRWWARLHGTTRDFDRRDTAIADQRTAAHRREQERAVDNAFVSMNAEDRAARYNQEAAVDRALADSDSRAQEATADQAATPRRPRPPQLSAEEARGRGLQQVTEGLASHGPGGVLDEVRQAGARLSPEALAAAGEPQATAPSRHQRYYPTDEDRARITASYEARGGHEAAEAGQAAPGGGVYQPQETSGDPASVPAVAPEVAPEEQPQVQDVAEATRSELAPDQQRVVAGGTPDAAQRQPTGNTDYGTRERERWQAAMNATRFNRVKNGLLGLAGAFLGARSGTVSALQETSDTPMRDFESWKSNEESIRRGNLAQQRSAQQSATSSQAASRADERLAMERERLGLARDRASQSAEHADRNLAMREAGLESTNASRALSQEEARREADESARMTDPSSDVSNAMRQQVVARGVPEETVAGMGARELLEVYGRTSQARGRRRSGSGRRAPRERTAEEQSTRDTAVNMIADAYGQDAEGVGQMFDSLSSRNREALVRDALSVGGRFAGRHSQRQEFRNTDRDTRYHLTRERYGIPVADTALRRTESAISGLSDAQIRTAALTIGAPSGINALMEADPAAGELARSFQALINVKLKNDAGTAVTDSEFARIIASLGGGSVVGGLSVRTAIQVLRRELNARTAEIDRGFQDTLQRERVNPPRLRNPGVDESQTPDTGVLTNPSTGRRRRGVTRQQAQEIADRHGLRLEDIYRAGQ